MSPQKPTGKIDLSDEFVQLLIANQPRLFAYIISLVPNWADADEIFQECSLVLWSKRNEFITGTNFLAWSCQIALNKVFNHRKQQSHSRLVFDDEFLNLVAAERLAGEERLEERATALSHCIEKLRSRDRDLLSHWYQRKGTTKHVAQQMGRPLDTVYKALKRIRGSLLDCVTRSLNAGELT